MSAKREQRKSDAEWRMETIFLSERNSEFGNCSVSRNSRMKKRRKIYWRKDLKRWFWFNFLQSLRAEKVFINELFKVFNFTESDYDDNDDVAGFLFF